jgi:hypothetical protein
MSDAGSLSATEARNLRRRHAVAQYVLGLGFFGLFVALFALGPEDRDVWALLCVLWAAICCFAHLWSTRCPRCGRSVFGPPPVDPNAPNPGELTLGKVLPYQCRTCGVCLWPAETGGRTVEPNGPGATDSAEPGASPDRCEMRRFEFR